MSGTNVATTFPQHCHYVVTTLTCQLGFSIVYKLTRINSDFQSIPELAKFGTIVWWPRHWCGFQVPGGTVGYKVLWYQSKPFCNTHSLAPYQTNRIMAIPAVLDRWTIDNTPRYVFIPKHRSPKEIRSFDGPMVWWQKHHSNATIVQMRIHFWRHLYLCQYRISLISFLPCFIQ